MRKAFGLSALLVSTVAVSAPATISAFDITTCSQHVPPRETGVLLADLSCGDGSGGPNVTLGRGARLKLNGHTISGGYIGVLTGTPPSRSIIEGPGEIVGVANSLETGCGIVTDGKAVIKDLTIRDSRCGISRLYNYPVVLDNVTIENNDLDGILNEASPSPGNGSISVRESVVTGNGGIGIRAPAKLRLKESDVSNNGVGGVRATYDRPAVIVNSTLTGNGFAGDIAANVAPKFVGSTCDASQDIDSGGTLGICTTD